MHRDDVRRGCCVHTGSGHVPEPRRQQKPSPVAGDVQEELQMQLHRGHPELRVQMRHMRRQGLHDPSDRPEHQDQEDKDAPVTLLNGNDIRVVAVFFDKKKTGQSKNSVRFSFSG